MSGAYTGHSEKETERQYEALAKGNVLVREWSKKEGRPLTACVKTFGCQMNARDSEKLTGILLSLGFMMTESEEADVVLYNTCTIRENANTKVYGHLGLLKNLKQKHPNMMIALCGCMMQEAHVIEEIKKRYPFVNLVFGTHNVFKFAELFLEALETGHQVIDVWEDTKQIVENLPNARKYAFKSGINITYGCNNFCTYCIVPYVRGRERDRLPEEILSEIRKMADDGVVEVMLLGQNVNSYGKTLKEPLSFAGLLRQVAKIEGIRRIRFMTSHPKDLSEELIDVMAEEPKICPHIHLPLQSGSSRILKKMNRRYDKEQYLQLVDRIRAKIPDISLTTDIIVGFPGETEEDFLETLDVVNRVRFDSAFTFLYSRRTGTPAAKMEDQVPADVAQERFDRLLGTVSRIAGETCARYEDTVQTVLVEQINRQDAALVTGRMENNIVVHFPGDASLIGKIVPVHLLQAHGFYYTGEQVL